MARFDSYLPEDIVINILSRLPVKSLLRCRAVSKSWLSIVSDSQFIQSHGRIAAKKKPWILVNQTLQYTSRHFGYIFMPKCLSLHGCRFIGSYNGIVCVADYYCNFIYLWNPSIKKYKRVPTPKKYSHSPVYYRSIGFGYDFKSNDFKILCVEHGYDYLVNIVQLYSTNCGFWREIRVNIPLPYALCNRCGPVIKGIMYFKIWDKENKEDVLVSFDLFSEIFGVVPIHSCIQERSSNIFKYYPSAIQKRRSDFLDFEGSLAIIMMDTNNDRSLGYVDDVSVHKGISVWTLEDDGEVSWTKRISIRSDELTWIKKLGFKSDFWIDMYLGNGQFYGQFYGRNYIDYYCELDTYNFSHIWYNYKKKEDNGFDIGKPRCPDVVKYTESLVSFKGFKFTRQSTERRSKRKRMRISYYKYLDA